MNEVSFLRRLKLLQPQTSKKKILTTSPSVCKYNIQTGQPDPSHWKWTSHVIRNYVAKFKQRHLPTRWLSQKHVGLRVTWLTTSGHTWFSQWCHRVKPNPTENETNICNSISWCFRVGLYIWEIKSKWHQIKPVREFISTRKGKNIAKRTPLSNFCTSHVYNTNVTNQHLAIQ